jgi:hypothetical protein
MTLPIIPPKSTVWLGVVPGKWSARTFFGTLRLETESHTYTVTDHRCLIVTARRD